MSDSERCRKGLQKKVQNIAVGMIVIHVLGVVGEIMQYSQSKYNQKPNYAEFLGGRTAISIIMESLIGIVACVMLFFGAKKKNRYLLIPFMLIMVVLQVFLVVSMFILGMLCLHGDPVVYVAMGFIMILISLTCWMLRTTKALYDEIRTNAGLVPATTSRQCTTDNVQSCTQIAHQDSLAALNYDSVDLEAYVDGHYLHIPAFNPSSQAIENPAAQFDTSAPPAYDETPAVSNSVAVSELPPTYDEAMIMKKKQVNIDDE